MAATLPPDRRHQRRRVEGLHHEVVASGDHRRPLRRVSRHDDDRDVGEARLVPRAFEECSAVEVRDVKIEQHDARPETLLDPAKGVLDAT